MKVGHWIKKCNSVSTHGVDVVGGDAEPGAVGGDDVVLLCGGDEQ